MLAPATQAVGVEPASRSFVGTLPGKMKHTVPIGRTHTAKISRAGTILNLFTAPPSWRFLTTVYGLRGAMTAPDAKGKSKCSVPEGAELDLLRAGLSTAVLEDVSLFVTVASVSKASGKHTTNADFTAVKSKVTIKFVSTTQGGNPLPVGKGTLKLKFTGVPIS